jgi:sugar fermentation stimulation protein A
MIYNNVCEASFISRPNRFLAYVLLGDEKILVHLNTGPSKEILKTGTRVLLSSAPVEAKGRKTKYSIVAAYKDDKLINIDGQISSSVIVDAILSNSIPEFQDIKSIEKRRYYNSVLFDIFYKSSNSKDLLIVYNVTLEKDGIAMFPDGKHKDNMRYLTDIISVMDVGDMCHVIFLVQMSDISKLRLMGAVENRLFYSLLEYDVNLLVYNSKVTPNSIQLGTRIDYEFKVGFYEAD